MPTADLKFVEAYRASHSIQAHALRMALEEAGIRVIIENEALQGAIGDVPPGWSSAPRLLVEESQLSAAREIIGRADHGKSFDLRRTQSEPTRCLACDAIMAEAETACPKCGWSYEPDDSAKPL